MEVKESKEKLGLEFTPLQPQKEKKETEFEDILNLIGSQGRYQKILLYGILCPFIAASPFFVLNQIFLLDIPDHWCKVEYGNFTYELDEWKNLTIPRFFSEERNLYKIKIFWKNEISPISEKLVQTVRNGLVNARDTRK